MGESIQETVAEDTFFIRAHLWHFSHLVGNQRHLLNVPCAAMDNKDRGTVHI